MNHCIWNIQGYESKIIGKNLLSQDFLNEIHDCDIIGVAETHIHTQVLAVLVLPGYDTKHYKNRKTHSNGKCGLGGMAIFLQRHSKGYYHSSKCT